MAITSCSTPKPSPPSRDQLVTLEAEASLHDSWAVAQAARAQATPESIVASVRARFTMIRSKAINHEVIAGSEMLCSSREERDGQIIMKDCLLVTAQGQETVAGDECVVKDHGFTFSGRPARSFGDNYSLGKEDTVMKLVPQAAGEYSTHTTGKCTTTLDYTNRNMR